MTLTLELTHITQDRLRRKAEQEGQDESSVASRLLSELLAQEFSGQDAAFSTDTDAEGTMADLFAGRVGTVSGSSEPYSENGGKRFADHLVRKYRKK